MKRQKLILEVTEQQAKEIAKYEYIEIGEIVYVRKDETIKIMNEFVDELEKQGKLIIIK